MSDARRVDVLYSRNHWLASVAPGFDSEFEGASLTELVEAVQRAFPSQPFVFVIDHSTVEGRPAAKVQIAEMREQDDVRVILSVQEF